MNQRRFWIVLSGAGYIAVVVLSLLPGEFRPSTGESHYYEHLVAYAMVGFCFALALQSASAAIMSAGGLSATAGMLELLQHLVPGRTPEVAGFAAGALGAWAGTSFAIGIVASIKHWRGEKS